MQVYGRSPPIKTKSEFQEIVVLGHQQGDLEEAIPGSQAYDNTSQVSSVEDQSNFTAPSVEEIDPENQPSGSKGATYENLKGLPNIHAGLHLWDVARVWSNCRHIYTLLREDKHRKYKREIPKMNHRNIASQIISLERVRKTINFGIMGTFRYSYPAVHKAFMVVKKECGSLFKAFNKQGLIGAREEDEVIEPDYIIPDGEHQIPALQHFISASQVLQQHDELLRVLQPHREPELGKFHTLFRLAMLEENQTLVCFSIGDFIVVRDGHISRIDGIFKHCIIGNEWRVFLIVTFTDNKMASGMDKILECPVYELQDTRFIIGLPAVHSESD
ncbi:hypothetical protein CDV36_009501 [Fusarium kuroshium]|uniref:Uncharacterized protein n=1 Tax=Fusarium kuroshium TaxID=2010991 RepID=A0A3M2S042_9HYPO|nr:hypothetical protein CDV36_009501 [Fusarium kuroshium]